MLLQGASAREFARTYGQNMVAFVEGYPVHRSCHDEQRNAEIGSVTQAVTLINFSGPYKAKQKERTARQEFDRKHPTEVLRHFKLPSLDW